MYIANFDGCCKAHIIYGFGGGHAEEDDKIDSSAYLERESKKDILKYLKKRVKYLRSIGGRVLFACPTNHQPEAIEALQEFGFYGVDEKEINSICGTVYKHPDEKGTLVKVDHYMVPMFYLIPKK